MSAMKFVSPPEDGAAWVMPEAWLQIALLAAIACALLALMLRARRKRATPCKWRKENRARASGMQRWACKACGVDAFTQDGKPPKECKRGLREAQL
ncbi:hypothetical protein [Ovoidimarina sediminis]|uniref:hypothetical protein n=1 Tax=Ovoidimarina sediminis TaxID=3079856 RepID=UPI002931C535|nr:hypothetical protein [Rhodophyticola sp. MJ-SS7]